MNFKKILLNITLLLTIFCLSFTLNNVNASASTEYEYITKTDGNYLTYRGTNIKVEVPKNYTPKTTEFRGVWVSPFAGDISGFTQTEEVYRKELLTVLDTMEKYNLNAIVFHIRTHNDAFYNTKLAPLSSYMSAANFTKWDPLTWFIDECHARGIEFHAWLNPYRIASTSTTMTQIRSKYANFKGNPASKEENVLIGKSGAILDPGRPDVKKYLVEACMEVVQKYDVDAIHFDDYFYMSGIDDSKTYELYKEDYNNVDVPTFRRLQVDEFIENLSKAMYEFNIKNNRCVQLGISPSGIYRNGSYSNEYKYDDNGTLISPLESNSAGFAHYGDYLYSDTKKWIDNEWIDYITPQLYGSFESGGCPYADVVDWWAQVVKYKKVNLYTGLGIYHSTGNSDKGWYTKGNTTLELTLKYNQKHESVDGFCLYQYRTIKTEALSNPDFKNVFSTMLTNKALTPRIPRYSLEVDKVNNVQLIKGQNTFTIKFDGSDNAYKYAVYKVEGQNSIIDINDVNQLVTLSGKKEVNTVIMKETSDNYTYGVVAINQANECSEVVTISGKDAVSTVDFPFAKFNDIKAEGTISATNKYYYFIVDAVTLYFGDDVKYKIYSSSDQNNWELVEEINSMNNGSHSIRLKFNDDFKPIYYKVVVYNEFGELESDTIKVDLRRVNIVEIFDYFIEEINEGILNLFK